MQLSFVTLDVFTSTPFRGNPLAIVKIPANDSDELKQDTKLHIAQEFNLSETVFLHEQSSDEAQEGVIRIDIFTCYAELPFAGHPTVGTTNYLLRYLKQEFKTLRTKSGDISVTSDEGGKEARLQLAHNVHIHNQPFKDRPYGHYPVVSITKGLNFILIKVKDLDELAQQKKPLYTEYQETSELDEGWQTGLILNYFYADLGVDKKRMRQIRTRSHGEREDPATGSAAATLCSYLSLSEEGEKTRTYLLTQGVEMGRQSDIGVQVTLKDSGDQIDKVVLSGTAVKVMEGTMEVP